MRKLNRWIAIAALVCGAAAVTTGSVAEAIPVKPGPCPLERRADETVPHFSKRLIRCAAHRWSIRGGADRAICVARHESGLNPKAVGGDGDYLGLFQHLASAWPSRYDSWTRPKWELGERALNGRTNTVVSIRMVHADGWAPWRGTHCADA